MMGRAQTLVDLIKQNDLHCGAELGCYEGQTADFILTQCPEFRLLCVDLWHPMDVGLEKSKETGVAPYTIQMMEAAKAKARAVFEKHAGRMSVLELHTVDAAKEVPDESLDFVFIDADHSTEAVVRDAMDWMPKVRHAGYLLGHDEDWPSVRRALAQLWTNGYTLLRGNVWMVRKI
jgi:hypothetical protein